MDVETAAHIGRILVVEDDPLIRELLETLLIDEGFAVDTAAHGLAALNLLERHRYALMITDIALPGSLDGVTLVRYARAHASELKSLFISGYSGPVCDDSDRDDFIAKPFNRREFLGCVWELLLREQPQRCAIDLHRGAELALLETRIDGIRNQPPAEIRHIHATPSLGANPSGAEAGWRA